MKIGFIGYGEAAFNISLGLKNEGITGIRAKGMYSGNDKLMLFCVVGKKELVHLKEMIDEMMEQADKLLGGCQK